MQVIVGPTIIRRAIEWLIARGDDNASIGNNCPLALALGEQGIMASVGRSKFELMGGENLEQYKADVYGYVQFDPPLPEELYLGSVNNWERAAVQAETTPYVFEVAL